MWGGEEDAPRCEEISAGAVRRVPAMADAGVRQLINGPEAFTPDNEFILGESEVRGLFVVAGFSAHGIASAGGMGRQVAQWIVDGDPQLDLWKMDVRRFGAAYRSPAYKLARSHENYATYYDIHFPNEERQAGRPLRLSPTYPRLVELDCALGEKSGWERPNWFESNGAAGDETLRPRGWAGRHWSPAIGAEALATRQGAALFDETSFSKIEISGYGALAFLQRLCDNEMAMWDALWQAGRPHGLMAGGYRAIDSLRLEKGYRVWSSDITPEDNPYEAGLGFAVRIKKAGSFIGQEGLVAEAGTDPARRLCCLVLDDPLAVALDNEPIRVDGEVVGRVTSGGYGFAVERSIAYGYLPAARAQFGQRGEVEVFGEWVGCEVAAEPLYDPDGERVRS